MSQLKKLNKWEDVDDFRNEVFWSFHKNDNFETEKIKFLTSLCVLLNENNINYSLHANTKNYLLNLKQYKKNLLFDEIIISKKDLKKILSTLSKTNYAMFRDRYNRLIVLNNKKVIKISLVFFNLKSKNINQVNIDNYYFSYLKKSVSTSLYTRISIIFIIHVLNKSKKYVTRKLLIKKNNKFELKKISYREFLELKIERKNSFNWILRKPHLDIVTNNGKNKKIKNIIKHFKKNNNYFIAKNNIIITNTSLEFEEPIQINERFWLKGNNYFILPMIYQFRKNVVPYEKANEYVRKQLEPMLYSENYYSNLEVMDYEEIKSFLKDNPIEIVSNTVTSGRHRVFAMIGRIIENKEYLEFYAYVK